MAVCEAGKLGKEGDVWEWTSTEVSTEEGNFKALCGPMDRRSRIAGSRARSARQGASDF